MSDQVITNWHNYYNNIPKDWFLEFLDEYNDALQAQNFEEAERLEIDATGRGVWVDKSACFRHPDDPHKSYALDEILSDDWIEF